MSERLVIPDRAEAEHEVQVARPWWQFSLRFNVAISQSVPVARIHEGESEGVMMLWGLVSPAAKGDVRQLGASHARSSTLDSSEQFRRAWLHGHRGIVPVAGFYLWQCTHEGNRQPYYVRLVNRSVFGVAVLWERSVSDDDDVVESCALITVPSNHLIAEIDNTTEQMPAILHHAQYDAWLRSNVSDARALLQSYPAIRMVTHPVPPHVNDLELDDARLIRPAS